MVWKVIGFIIVAAAVFIRLRIWITNTISLGPVDKLYSLAEAATIIS